MVIWKSGRRKCRTLYGVVSAGAIGGAAAECLPRMGEGESEKSGEKIENWLVCVWLSCQGLSEAWSI